MESKLNILKIFVSLAIYVNFKSLFLAFLAKIESGRTGVIGFPFSIVELFEVGGVVVGLVLLAGTGGFVVFVYIAEVVVFVVLVVFVGVVLFVVFVYIVGIVGVVVFVGVRVVL